MIGGHDDADFRNKILSCLVYKDQKYSLALARYFCKTDDLFTQLKHMLVGIASLR